MAKISNKVQIYSEADLVQIFDLKSLQGNNSHPLLKNWLNTTTILTLFEQELFDSILDDAAKNIRAWHEEELKMQFIAFVVIKKKRFPTRSRFFYAQILRGLKCQTLDRLTING